MLARTGDVLGRSVVRPLPPLTEEDASDRIRGVDRGEDRVPGAGVGSADLVRRLCTRYIFLRLPEMLLGL